MIARQELAPGNCSKVVLTEIARANLPTKYGQFTLATFVSTQSQLEYVVLFKKPDNGNTPLVRVHRQCETGDIFGSNTCNCRQHLESSLRLIGRVGGALIYRKNQEGKGIDFTNIDNHSGFSKNPIDYDAADVISKKVLTI